MTPREPRKISLWQHILNKHGDNVIPAIIIWSIIGGILIYILFKGGC